MAIAAVQAETMMQQVQVLRSDFAETRIVTHSIPDLADGEVLFAIERFALTANNVSYALSGDMIGYWRFYPAEGPCGHVPVWGFATVVASRNSELPIGDRMWGFLPMATHVVMTPGQITARGFTDVVKHRQDLPGVYNRYQRTAGDTPELAALADERCLFFPLFSTSYVLYDYLVDNQFFGAQQIVVGSASSKTGLGLCKLLLDHGEGRPQVIGLTSPGNRAFVENLQSCDQVAIYAEIDKLAASQPTGFVDMSGDAQVIAAIHAHIALQLTLSCAVDATHWRSSGFRGRGALPHEFFFAPAQFAKRDLDWGPGEILSRAQIESIRLSSATKGMLQIHYESGPMKVAAAFTALVNGLVSPNIGVIDGPGEMEW